MLKLTLAALVVLLVAATAPVAQAGTMTFDSITESHTKLPYGDSYVEDGLELTSYSYETKWWDWLGMPTTPLYFHGLNEYVEFQLESGSNFDLLTFQLLTNGNVARWLETSNSGGRLTLGAPVSIATLTFSGSPYSNISWFRVGSMGHATQVDNISVRASSSIVPLPSAAWAGLGLLGVIGAVRRYRRRRAA